jgi:hypothetical protein
LSTDLSAEALATVEARRAKVETTGTIGNWRLLAEARETETFAE